MVICLCAISLSLYIYICMYVCMSVCMYVFMYVCICIYIYIYIVHYEHIALAKHTSVLCESMLISFEPETTVNLCPSEYAGRF